MAETKNTAAKQQENMRAENAVPGISADDAARLDDVQGKIEKGLENGDRSQMDALMKEQSEILQANGIVYPGSEPSDPKSGEAETGDGTAQQAANGAELPDYTGQLKNWHDGAQVQQSNAIDYATQQGINELERAEQDAQEQFQSQLNQTNREEAKALDNQVLYAEARGDRGGIGQAQYAQIQSAAMENRRTIHAARTKLATDTARQIADLRAQGEFQKADAVLQLTQEYLGRLMEMQQWNAEYVLSREEFREQVDRWNAEFAAAQGESQYEKDLQKARLLAAAGDFSGYKALGYSDGQIAVLSGEAESNADVAKDAATEKMRDEVSFDINIDRENRIYTWGETPYDDLDSMVEAINERGLTDEELEELNRNAAKYDIRFEVVR